MLLKQESLRGIQEGRISLAFRRWRRPTVKAGGTLLTAIGQLAIEAVDVVSPDDLEAADAVAAGFDDLVSLRAFLSQRSRGDVYRIRLSLLGPDPRVALRERDPSDAELDGILARLRRLDRRATPGPGPWTRRVLELICRRPAVRAADLAGEVGMARADFKVRVRRLKALGLTESLPVGYRLSRRGAAVLARWDPSASRAPGEADR